MSSPFRAERVSKRSARKRYSSIALGVVPAVLSDADISYLSVDEDPPTIIERPYHPAPPAPSVLDTAIETQTQAVDHQEEKEISAEYEYEYEEDDEEEKEEAEEQNSEVKRRLKPGVLVLILVAILIALLALMFLGFQLVKGFDRIRSTFYRKRRLEDLNEQDYRQPIFENVPENNVREHDPRTGSKTFRLALLALGSGPEDHTDPSSDPDRLSGRLPSQRNVLKYYNPSFFIATFSPAQNRIILADCGILKGSRRCPFHDLASHRVAKPQDTEHCVMKVKEALKSLGTEDLNKLKSYQLKDVAVLKCDKIREVERLLQIKFKSGYLYLRVEFDNKDDVNRFTRTMEACNSKEVIDYTWYLERTGRAGHKIRCKIRIQQGCLLRDTDPFKGAVAIAMCPNSLGADQNAESQNQPEEWVPGNPYPSPGRCFLRTNRKGAQKVSGCTASCKPTFSTPGSADIIPSEVVFTTDAVDPRFRIEKLEVESRPYPRLRFEVQGVKYVAELPLDQGLDKTVKAWLHHATDKAPYYASTAYSDLIQMQPSLFSKAIRDNYMRLPARVQKIINDYKRWQIPDFLKFDE